MQIGFGKLSKRKGLTTTQFLFGKKRKERLELLRVHYEQMTSSEKQPTVTEDDVMIIHPCILSLFGSFLLNFPFQQHFLLLLLTWFDIAALLRTVQLREKDRVIRDRIYCPNRRIHKEPNMMTSSLVIKKEKGRRTLSLGLLLIPELLHFCRKFGNGRIEISTRRILIDLKTSRRYKLKQMTPLKKKKSKYLHIRKNSLSLFLSFSFLYLSLSLSPSPALHLLYL